MLSVSVHCDHSKPSPQIQFIHYLTKIINRNKATLTTTLDIDGKRKKESLSVWTEAKLNKRISDLNKSDKGKSDDRGAFLCAS
jgi:hypothetical protein